MLCSLNHTQVHPGERPSEGMYDNILLWREIIRFER